MTDLAGFATRARGCAVASIVLALFVLQACGSCHGEPPRDDGGAPSGPVLSGGGPFEDRASVLGRVVLSSGGPVAGYTLSVTDLPGATPRSDVALTTAADGSFRAQLQTFPTTEPDRSPPHHVLVRIEGDAVLPIVRDAYLHPGSVVDLGTITAVARDSAVTMIGSEGGTAKDSRGLVTITFPPGAIATPTPIVITPMMTRDEVPFPLPDTTGTTYAFEVEPDGLVLGAPATVRLDNYRSLPPSLEIPVGVLDRANGVWLHEGFARWDGTSFAFPIEHFSARDINTAADLWELVIMFLDGAPNKPQAQPDGPPTDACVGSSVRFSNGALRQQISTPTYQAAGRTYGVTLSYDSSLTLGAPNPSSPGAVGRSGLVGLPARGGKISSQCVPQAAADQVIASTPGSCSGGACGGGSLLLRGLGDLNLSTTADGITTNAPVPALPDKATDFEIDFGVPLPLNKDGTLPPPSFHDVTITLLRNGGPTCAGGGAAFGGNISNNPGVVTTQEPGPLLHVPHSVFVNHRHTSPYGTGWGIEGVGRLYRAPAGDLAVIAQGDGTEESFGARATTSVVLFDGALPRRALARDPQTGEMFVLTGRDISKFAADGTRTPLLSAVAFSSDPIAAAITYVGGVRHFVVALEDGLADVDASGQLRPLIAVPKLTDLTQLPSVAAHGDVAFYSDGKPDSPRLLRFRLSAAMPAAEAMSLIKDGDIGLDPQKPLGHVTFGDVHGLAFDASGALYIGDRRKNVVFRAAPAASGEVDATSQVVRAVGSGSGKTVLPLGYRVAGPRFEVNQPLLLSMGTDGTLWIVTQFGAAAYDTLAQEARWLFFEPTSSAARQITNLPAEMDRSCPRLAAMPRNFTCMPGVHCCGSTSRRFRA